MVTDYVVRYVGFAFLFLFCLRGCVDIRGFLFRRVFFLRSVGSYGILVVTGLCKFLELFLVVWVGRLDLDFWFYVCFGMIF